MGRKEKIKSAIEDALLEHFRTTAPKAGSVLSPEWLYDDFLVSLSANEEKILEEAVNEMIREGLIEYVAGRRPTYRLTEKGEQALC